MAVPVGVGVAVSVAVSVGAAVSVAVAVAVAVAELLGSLVTNGPGVSTRVGSGSVPPFDSTVPVGSGACVAGVAVVTLSSLSAAPPQASTNPARPRHRSRVTTHILGTTLEIPISMGKALPVAF